MDVREKLVELQMQAKIGWTKEEFADHLIAHGVTVQEWISVKDRLPDDECRCLVIDGCDDIEMDVYDGKGKFVLDHSSAVQHPKFWMPLPQPPKGE